MRESRRSEVPTTSRRGWLAVLGTGVVLGTGCVDLPIGTGTYERSQASFDPPDLGYDETHPADVDVSMFRRGTRRLGYYPDATVPDRMTVTWEMPVNYLGHTAAKSSPRPTPGGGTVVVAGDTGHVHARSTMGEHRWTAQTGATHLGIHGTPTILDGVAYVGGYDGDLYAYAVDSGELLWRTRNSEMGGPTAIGASPAYWDGVLYAEVEYLDPEAGRLWAFDASTGEPLWSDDQDIRGMPHPSPAIDPATERLVIGSNDGVVYAWEFPSLEFAWSFQTGQDTDEQTPVKGTMPVYEGGVFVGSWDNSVYRLDLEDGTEEWSFDTDGIVMSNPGVDPDSGTVYVGSGDNHVYALDAATGDLVWERDVGGTVLGSLTVTAETVLVGSYDTHLYALEKDTGRVRWRFQGRGHATSEPVPHDGRLYYAERANLRNYWNDDRETEIVAPGHVYRLSPF